MIQDVLAAHFAQYPYMEPQDAVKLLYQAEFGPEHMIRDEKKSLQMLKDEMALLRPVEGEKMYESIGNGLCRWNLRPCMAKGIPAEDINQLFVETSRSVKGDKRSFRESLRALEEMAEGDETPFEAIQLDIFLIQYRDRNCPPVHHSDAYRQAYRPAYRVVSQKKLKDYLKALREKNGK
ncbi:MAG: hypothetical protein IJ189_05895 [Clostridia bacterium]|nr:hypothetical protein [Clostridia bacterium]